ncbi:MAG: Asp-tRNA(Asn)/Glu-tRNA(Gln) amidotransferase subunit GatA [Gemmatimonadetes bacterium]|nr:Asp-tRNA(Asn)/Glu-tRNA(Gln) amidotransferase subunit GatA [Gemmatimonadota bacterium]
MTLARDLAGRTADAIERVRDLNAVISYDRATLIGQASAVDADPGRGRGPLAGAPLAVKDNICTLEYPTTCASRILGGYRSPFEATAIARLKAAGAVIACKTNLDEFAMGASTEYSAFGRTRHPLDPDRVPGGSSGGSAALVAAGAVAGGLGSETGGSVRQPAAFCGIVGIKPTYGRVSRYGLVAFGSSLDQIAVFGRTVRHAAQLLGIISGRDPHDATCADLPPLEVPGIPKHLRGVVIGRPEEFYPQDLDAGIRAACDRALRRFQDAGATVRTVSMPHTALAVPTYYVIAPAEASSNLARYDGVRYGPRVPGPNGDVRALYRATRGAGFGPEVRRRIIIGTYVLSAGYYGQYYRKAQVARSLITSDYQKVFQSAGNPAGVDLLFTPTTPTPAFRAGEKVDDPVAMYLADIFVCTANLAQVPAMSVPIGRTNGLPIGGQLIAPHFEEGRMIAAASVLERILDATEEVR